MAELVTVVQSIWPAARASSDFGIRRGDVAAFVDDGLRDDAAGGGEHFGEHFAAAAGAGQEESFAVRMRCECFGQRFGAVGIGRRRRPCRWYVGERVDRGGADRGELAAAECAQVVAEREQAAEEILDAVAAREHEPIEVGESVDHGVDRRPIRGLARSRSPAGRARRHPVRGASATIASA